MSLLSMPERPGPAGEETPSPADDHWAGTAIVAAVVVGMLAAATYRSGGFFPQVAVGIAALGAIVIVLALFRGHDRRGLRVVMAVGALALWWLVRSFTADTPKAFLPLGASILGFLAAFLATRPLTQAGRARVAQALVAIASVSGAASIVAVLIHWSALSSRAGETWRVATTMGYANAAGLVLGMALLVALGLDETGPWTRMAVVVCLASLIATQSVVALLAVAAGLVLVPRARWTAFPRALPAGVLLGAVTVAASTRAPSPWLLAPILLGLAWVWLAPERTASDPRTRRPIVLAIVVLVSLAVVIVASRGSGHHLFSAQSDRLDLAWHSIIDQWWTSSVTGLGPHGVTNLTGAVGLYDNFLGNDYLQVLLDAGIVGAVLLAASVAAVAATVKRCSTATSCAAAALVTFAVGGLVDYGWHLPAVAIAGGIVAALASEPVDEVVFTRSSVPVSPAAGRGRLRWLVGSALVVVALVAVGLAVRPASHRVSTAAAAPAAAGTLAGPESSAVVATGVIAVGPDLTDPFIVHDGDQYHLYTGQGETPMNVPVRTSTSLGSWGPPQEALPELPAWAGAGQTWAPDVRQVDGGWALYFTTLMRDVVPGTHCIGAAFGPSATGPFVALDQPFVCQLDHRGTIDPRTFLDHDGQLILHFKSEDNANPRIPGPDQNGKTAIWAQRLSPDGRTLYGPVTQILTPTQPWEGTIIEAPDMVNIFGHYWLFFSGGWFNTDGYAIGYARCEGPFGPCTDLSPTPLLGSNPGGSGPGESSVFVDGQKAYLLYNPWHASGATPLPPRPVSMLEIAFGVYGPEVAQK